MYSRLVVPLICAAAIVFACGPRTHTAGPSSASRRAARAEARATSAAARAVSVPATPFRRAGDTSAVAARFDVEGGPGGVRLALQVVNRTGHRVEIDFPDGQTRDFVVLDATGHEVWRWSRGRLFTQAVQNKFLAAGDTAVYTERWDAPKSGVYTAVAELRSRNYPVEQRMTFTVRSAVSAPTVGPDVASLVP